MKPRLTTLKRLVILYGLFAATAIFGQMTYAWIGGDGTGTEIGAAINWGGTLPNLTNADTGQFDGNMPDNLNLIYNTGTEASGFGSSSSWKLAANQTGSVNIHSVANIVNSQRPIIEKSAKPGLPIHVTEWSASYSPRDPVHDSYFSAPFILEQLRHTESVSSMSYWTFTDIFEENGSPPRPFHGGFGLINYQGIRKPAFWAYQFLAQLGGMELQNSDGSSYVCTDTNGGAQVLLWDITNPTDGKVSDQDYFFHPHPARDKGRVSVRLKDLPPGQYSLTIHQVGYGVNDSYSCYLELGQPPDLSRVVVAGKRCLFSFTHFWA